MIPGWPGGVSYWGGAGKPATHDTFTGGGYNHNADDSGAWGHGGAGSARNFNGSAGKQGVVLVESFK